MPAAYKRRALCYPHIMATPINVTRLGSSLAIKMSDGATFTAVPTGGHLWYVKASGGGPVDPGTGALIDWWTADYGQGAIGDWESHASYSRGGTDWSLPYNFAIKAPASGTIVNGANEDAAGLKSMLVLDAPVARKLPASPTLMNGVYYENPTAPAVAFVMQHLNAQVPPGHYDQGQVIGYAGNTAGPGSTGDQHLHSQLLAGLSFSSDRLDFMKFV